MIASRAMSGLQNEIDSAIARALEQLSLRLLAHGELPASATRGSVLVPRCDSSPFATSMALRSLAAVPEARECELVERMLDFLVAEDQGDGLWGFWSTHSVQYGGLPPDADDTTTVLDVLRRFDRRVAAPRGALVGNRDRHGRFYTFVMPRWGHLSRPSAMRRLLRDRRFRSHSNPLYLETPATRDDVDSVVNAHTLLWLGEGRETKRALDWLIGLIASREERGADKWYPLELSLYVALALLWEEGFERLESTRRIVLDRIANRRPSTPQILEFALGLTACLAFGEPPAGLADQLRALLAMRDYEGLWPRGLLFFNGPECDVGWGSPDLSTALALEALARGREAL